MSAINRSKSAGFSLLELIIALAILSLIAGSSASTLGPKLFSGDARIATRTLLAAFQDARAEAIWQGAPSTVVIDLDERRIKAAGELRALPEKITLKILSAKETQTSESSAAIIFYPDGSSTGGEALIGAGSRTHIIRVDWLTGRISTEKKGADQ